MTRIALFLFAFLAGSFVLAPAQQAGAAEVVHFQCKEWKAKHIHSEKNAQKITDTMKKLGIEVKQEKHNGHFDVKYRCVKQRDMPVKSHAEAVKWEKWFKEYGFRVYHTH